MNICAQFLTEISEIFLLCYLLEMKKKVPDSLKPSQLISLPPEEIYNPDIETTWKSTLIGLLFLSLVGGWMYYVYLGYERWRTSGDSLPETGIVKV